MLQESKQGTHRTTPDDPRLKGMGQEAKAILRMLTCQTCELSLSTYRPVIASSSTDRSRIINMHEHATLLAKLAVAQAV
jgi:hypothetical protein